MSRLEDISKEFREKLVAKNTYDQNDPFTGSHENALSDGDELGKGENAGQVGSRTDIEQRELAAARNKYNQNKEYNDSTA